MHISFWLTLKHEILHSITKLYFSPMYCQAPLLNHLLTVTVRYSRCVLSTVIDSQAFLLLNADSSIFQWEKHLEQDESKHQAVLLGDHICTHTHSYLSRSQRNSKTQSDDTWFLEQRVTTWDRSQETLTETFQKQDVKTPKNTLTPCNDSSIWVLHLIILCNLIPFLSQQVSLYRVVFHSTKEIWEHVHPPWPFESTCSLRWEWAKNKEVTISIIFSVAAKVGSLKPDVFFLVCEWTLSWRSVHIVCLQNHWECSSCPNTRMS